MQSQLKVGVRPQAARPNWLPQRSSVLRRNLRVDATSGAAPPPAQDVSKDTVTRQYRRTVYDFALWRKHRDVNRYLYNLKTIPGSRIIRNLGQPMGIVLAWAAFFGFYETCLDSGILPAYLPKLTLTSAEPQGLTSFALSLLLVFRTNSSYGRFDEARKIWGGILNRARNIANQAVSFVSPEDVAGRQAVGKWTVGFCRALQAHLQEDADLRAELEKAQPRWSQEEIEILCSAQHRPIKAISMLSELTRQLSITEFQALQMQENVTFFYDALGGCERLLRTPIPVSYTRHTARFLTIWLTMLPLGLWDRYHWSMLPVIALIGFLLLGIDEIGITIEEPFGILPLDVICTRAQTDVVSLLKDDPAVSKYIADVRDGRVQGPAETVAIAAVPAAAAPPAAAPGSPAAPQQQGPGMMRTVSSILSNVRAGIGAVAPGAPPPPQPRSPSPMPVRASSPRTTSPGRPNPFPRASSGTGMVPPPVLPLAATAIKSNGSSKAAPALPPPPAAAVSANGFTLMSGLASGAAAAAKSASAAAAKVSKMADSMTAGTPLSDGPAAAASPKAPESEPAVAPSSPLAAQEDSSAASPAAAAPPAANGRVGINWRDELAVLKATRDEEPADAAGDESVSDADGAAGDDEAMQRFGGLAGRSRSAASRNGHNGNGNGHSSGEDGDGASSSLRPRTRPDWRNQL